MPRRNTTPRSRTRRAGESAYGLLLVLKVVLMSLVTLLLLVAGAWTSWDSARYVMPTGVSERGTMTVRECGAKECTGPFAPTGGSGEAREKVTIDESVTHRTGERLAVALRPGTDEALRTGPAGILHAWIPFAGALVLASLVIAGGLRMRRTAWGAGLLGCALMTASFVTL